MPPNSPASCRLTENVCHKKSVEKSQFKDYSAFEKHPILSPVMDLRIYISFAGLFLEPDEHPLLPGQGGLFKTGQWYVLGVQTLAAVSVIIWTIPTAYICLKVTQGTITHLVN